MLVIDDVGKDLRFAATGVRIGQAPLRFYAGMPLLSSIDAVRRWLTASCGFASRGYRQLGRARSSSIALRKRAASPPVQAR